MDQSTTLLDAFRLADDVLLAGVKSVTDLMTMPGLINLDFADVQVRDFLSWGFGLSRLTGV